MGIPPLPMSCESSIQIAKRRIGNAESWRGDDEESDARFAAHNGLKSDIAPCPKSAPKPEVGRPHSITSSRSWLTLPIGCAGDVDQDLAALEQMGDGFLDFRHRINRGDGNAQRPGGDERRGFDLRW
jgi:hypothetical protein